MEKVLVESKKILLSLIETTKKREKPYKSVCTCCVIKKNLWNSLIDEGSKKKLKLLLGSKWVMLCDEVENVNCEASVMSPR